MVKIDNASIEGEVRARVQLSLAKPVTTTLHKRHGGGGGGAAVGMGGGGEGGDDNLLGDGPGCDKITEFTTFITHQ